MNKYSNKGGKSKHPKINEQILSDKVRLVGADGDVVGVVNISEARNEALKAGMDLVEVSPDANPPVCKILDYGKYRYESQRKAKEAKKKQKTINIKEIKLRVNIDTHDYEVKIKAARKFLEKGDKVKFFLRFRGREAIHSDLGIQLFERCIEDLKDVSKIEFAPKQEGRQITMILNSNV